VAKLADRVNEIRAVNLLSDQLHFGQSVHPSALCVAAAAAAAAPIQCCRMGLREQQGCQGALASPNYKPFTRVRIRVRFHARVACKPNRDHRVLITMVCLQGA
jgi:hypothetical protein